MGLEERLDAAVSFSILPRASVNTDYSFDIDGQVASDSDYKRSEGFT